MLEWTSSERKNINRVSLSIYHTHTHSLECMSEREEARIRESEYCCQEIILLFWVLLSVLILSLRKLRGFLLYGFLEENICVYCLLCFIVVLVILSVKDPKIILA